MLRSFSFEFSLHAFHKRGLFLIARPPLTPGQPRSKFGTAGEYGNLVNDVENKTRHDPFLLFAFVVSREVNRFTDVHFYSRGHP